MTAQAQQIDLILQSGATGWKLAVTVWTVRDINRLPAIRNIKTLFLRERDRLMFICLKLLELSLI